MLTSNDKPAREVLIAAATIVNNAVLKCLVGCLPITHDNVILMIGDFADPTDVRNEPLIANILRLVDDMIEMADKFWRGTTF